MTSLHGHHYSDLLRSHDLTPPADDVCEALQLDAEYRQWLEANPSIKAKKEIESAFTDWQVTLSFIEDIDERLNGLTEKERSQGWYIHGEGTGNPIRWSIASQLQKRAQYVVEAQGRAKRLAEASGQFCRAAA